MSIANATVLFRPSLDARSGAGQLLALQCHGLLSAGEDALLACERGALRFWLRTGIRARRFERDELRRFQAQGAVLVDHGLVLPSADVVFVHNLASEVGRYLPRADDVAAVERERAFFAALEPEALVVANSRLVADAVCRHFAVGSGRVAVLYPGFAARRFTPARARVLRGPARAALGLDATAPLVGFVTSGDFAKRGLDTFLATAVRIASERPDARFLVVGSKRLPESVRAHPLVARGVVHYRPKSSNPERWFAALDVFLYPAVFEEFGLVVTEALAMGVPVLTSRRVGASECLPSAYEPWLVGEPDAAEFARRTLALLGDAVGRAQLALAGVEAASACDERGYVAGTVRLLTAQKLRLR